MNGMVMMTACTAHVQQKACPSALHQCVTCLSAKLDQPSKQRDDVVLFAPRTAHAKPTKGELEWPTKNDGNKMIAKSVNAQKMGLNVSILQRENKIVHILDTGMVDVNLFVLMMSVSINCFFRQDLEVAS